MAQDFNFCSPKLPLLVSYESMEFDGTHKGVEKIYNFLGIIKSWTNAFPPYESMHNFTIHINQEQALVKDSKQCIEKDDIVVRVAIPEIDMICLVGCYTREEYEKRFTTHPAE